MTTFIADFIFGRRDRRPRSRPSPAARLLSQLRLPARPEVEALPADTQPGRSDTGAAHARHAPAARGPGDGLSG